MEFYDLLVELKKGMGKSDTVVMNGNLDLDISSILKVLLRNAEVKISLSKQKIELFENVNRKKNEQIEQGIPMYGTTTSYGGRAGVVLNKGDKIQKINNAVKLSDSIIHVDVSTGDPIPKDIVRAAMMIRLNMLLSGVSGVRISTLQKLCTLLNQGITPIVGRYGSLGASGDLAQNGRVLSCLLQMPNVKVWDSKGNVNDAGRLMRSLNIKRLKLDSKEGLALVNGDNFSTASALHVAYETLNLLLINFYTNALVIQVLKGSNRNFHPFLSAVRPHYGQKVVSDIFRKLLDGSKLARQELDGHKIRENGEIVQDPYSIRCIPQYYGPDVESLISIFNTIIININSVSDNPLWVTPEYTTDGEEPFQWVSGGNFMAMHMSESLDRLRKMLVHLIKLNDRHLARMVHPHFNNGLTANLSDKKSISQSVFKGLQTQMGMFDVYSTLLVNPASTAFGNHEEFNQDITSQAPSSSILAWELLKVTKLATATNLIAACQAVDLRGGESLLSPATKPVYKWVRSFVPYISKSRPLGDLLDKVNENFFDDDLTSTMITTLTK